MAAASNAERRRLCPAFGAVGKDMLAIDTVPAIEDQLHTLQPICSAQRVSTGIACGAPAVAVAEIHAIDGCEQMGLSPDGDIVETLCQACLASFATGDRHLRGRQARDGVPMRHPPGVQHLRTSHSIPAQCLRCAPDRARGTGIMTRLRIACLFVAVVAGDYAALMLIDGQLIAFRRRRRHLCGILGRGRADRLRRRRGRPAAARAGQATPHGGGAGTSGRLGAP